MTATMCLLLSSVYAGLGWSAACTSQQPSLCAIDAHRADVCGAAPCGPHCPPWLHSGFWPPMASAGTHMFMPTSSQMSSSKLLQLGFGTQPGMTLYFAFTVQEPSATCSGSLCCHGLLTHLLWWLVSLSSMTVHVCDWHIKGLQGHNA